ncbi:MAG: glycosyltransferase family 4 protein [Acidimicrobiia bacterium]|nr:glycosyltransferase family 4 protein [Acidimicrobiia bacterium]
MRNPTLIHVTTADISLELLLGPQLRAFRDAGYRVIGASAPGPYVAGLVEDGIEHVALDHATRSMAPRRDVLALAELWRLFRRVRPDIVHTHNPKPGVYGRLAAQAARVPVVVNTVHGLYATPDDRFAKRAIVYTLERLAAACSDAELVQNPEDIPVLRRLRISADRLHLLGNGVDLDRFSPGPDSSAWRSSFRAELGVSESDVVVGAVGRLVWEKGYREVFAASRQLAATHPHVHMVVVGPTDPEKADGISTADIDAACDGTNLHVIGSRNDVERLYPAFDLYVLASYREGFPRSAMEAAAAGLAVVATDIRGCRQVVDHDVTGLLVAPRDAPALASAVAALADDPGRRASMSAAAVEKARDEFDQERVIGMTLDTYERLLSR